jgi:hypothetical protein
MKGNPLSRDITCRAVNLGKFFADAATGKYRGYALVIEALDRLSRLGITETFELLGKLKACSVELHETLNNRVIRSLDDLGTGVMALVDSSASV